MMITIEQCVRGFLVTTPSRAVGKRDWPLADDMYSVPTALAAIHCAATLLGVEPATLYAPAISLAETGSATGGGASSQDLLTAAPGEAAP